MSARHRAVSLPKLAPGSDSRWVSGFADDRSLPEFLADELGGDGARWALITRLDSAPVLRESPTVRAAVADCGSEARWSEAGLLISRRRAIDRLACEDLFFGFDQVVLFEQFPAALPPLPVTFTTDREWTAATELALTTYLDRCRARAAAADGAGLRWLRRTPQS